MLWCMDWALYGDSTAGCQTEDLMEPLLMEPLLGPPGVFWCMDWALYGDETVMFLLVEGMYIAMISRILVNVS